MITYLRADQLGFNPREQMGKVFAEAYYDLWLSRFSGDKAKLAKAFEHTFDLHCFYVAIENGEILAQAVCTDEDIDAVVLDKDKLIAALGETDGSLAYTTLTKELIDHEYPFEFTNSTGALEFVSTAPSHQGKGIAGNLLTYIFNNTRYMEYVLEVADTNLGAIHLYEKLGFHEFKRTEYIYMKKVKEA